MLVDCARLVGRKRMHMSSQTDVIPDHETLTYAASIHFDPTNLYAPIAAAAAAAAAVPNSLQRAG